MGVDYSLDLFGITRPVDLSEWRDASCFAEAVIKQMKEQICLDDSRHVFVKTNAKTIYNLVSNRLVNSTRHRRALLGTKGVGKSILLKVFCQVIQMMLPNFLILELSCDVDNDPLTRQISRKLGIAYDSKWDDILAYMMSYKLHMFVIIDEFHLAYNQSFEIGCKFISQVQCLGGEMLGRFHCILSGNSDNLRKLITAKLTKAEAESFGFSHYHFVDLNETKFNPFTILPFLKKNEFCSLLEFMKAKLQSQETYDWESLYLRSEGFPGQVFEIINGRCHNHYTIGLRDIQKVRDKYDFLIRLMRITSEMCQINFDSSSIYDEEEEIDWMNPVNVDLVDRDVTSKLLFDLADGGCIQFYEDRTPNEVGFYSPMIYLHLLARSNDCLTLTELLALKTPHNTYESLAEKTVAKLLMKCRRFWDRLGAHGVNSAAYADLGNLVLPGEHEKATRSTIPKGVLLRETFGVTKSKNCLGADFAIVLEQKVLRFQLKLGTETLKSSDFQSIQSQFNVGLPLAKKAYGKLGLELEENCNYLITTRPFRPEDTRNFTVGLIDSTFLGEVEAWPRVVLELGKPFKTRHKRIH